MKAKDLTQEQKDILTSAVNSTWSTIGSDAYQVNEGKEPPTKMKIELIADAGRIETYGGSKAAQEIIDQLDNWNEIEKALRPIVKFL